MEDDSIVERPRHRNSTSVTVCGVLFILCVLIGLAAQSAWPMVVGAPCWMVAYCIDKQHKRIYRVALEQYRNYNAPLYPEVFDRSPPASLDAVAGESVELYDCNSLTRLGIVQKSDIIAILKSYEDTPELLPKGSNDIPFTQIDFMYFRDCKPEALSESFTQLIEPIVDAKDQIGLTLRWISPRSGG